MPRKPLRTWRVALIGLLGVLALLFLASWLLLPRWLQSKGAELASQALGRNVSVQAVGFQPWALALKLDGLTVAGTAQQKDALLTVDSVGVNLSISSLWLGSPVIESLSVVRPTLRLSRLAPGHYDIDDLLARFAKPAVPQPDAKPVALALYNISLSEGSVLLDDRPAERLHELSGLTLDLPFVSNLAAHVEVHVQPQLSGRLNGVAFGAQGRALPFAQQRVATLDLKLDGLDLAPYAAYVPAGLPLRLKQGRVDADLQLKFQQAVGKAPEIGLAGQLQLSRFALLTPAGEPALAWADLSLQLLDVQPLRHMVKLGAISWTAPRLAMARDKRGALLLAGVAQESKSAPQPGKAAAWTLSLERFELSEGGLDWQDASTNPKAALRMQDIALKLGALAWPLQAQTPVSLALQLLPAGAGKPAVIDGSGELSAERLRWAWQWQSLELQWLTPYLQAQLPLRVSGLLGGKGELSLEQPLAADPGQRARVQLNDLQLTALAVAGKTGREPLLRLASLGLDQVSADLAARKLVAGTLTLSRPALQLARSLDGRWNYQDLQPPADPSGPSGTAPPWGLQLARLKLEQGQLRLADAGLPGGPLALTAEQIGLDLRQLAWPAQATAMPVNLSLKLGAQQRAGASKGPLGQLQWQGTATLAPLGASGKLLAERLPLQLLGPYLDPAWGLHLQKAELGLRSQFKAQLLPAGMKAEVTGKLLLADLLLHQSRQVDGQTTIGEELLSWQALNLDGVKLLLQPGGPPQLSIADVALDDFFARVIINEQGKVNLRDFGPAQQPPAAPTVATQTAPRMPISIGQIRVSKGRLDFNDRFVRPNYSARLSELQGSLGAFSSERAELAPLSVRGRVAGTGLLDVSGNVNPLGKPLLMDISASATDIELAPLSPYAAKYVGYAIERGKFSTKVQYKVDAGGHLQANNQIILNQLTFGEPVESPDATKLPVLFAVALLKDKDGVIDVELPISGSVNEPEFSVGGVIWKVIVNLLGKALSAPFSLFSGNAGADLSRLAFAPGSAQAVQPDALDGVAKMLEARPGLSLTIKAWADPVTERAALQQRQLDEALLAERQRELQRQQTTTPAAESLSEAERTRLLKPVYQAAKLPNKPKNLLGFAKDIAVPEMQALLLSSYTVSDDRVRALALERGVAVRDALIAKGLANSRIFLGAPSLHVEGAEPGQAWTPHAELQLSAH